MHMADALVSPLVGGVMWATSAGTFAISSRKVRERIDGGALPLMGVSGAFVFAAQMINFAIPGTGSSGHMGGGLLLAALLGPEAAFLAIASVLTIQALFFADGGLLALGCNLFNMGVLPAFVAYPLVFRPIAGASPSRGRLLSASLAGALVALQLGAFAVVLETAASGISRIPIGTFALLMQPIHLAIGLVEGLATAAVLLFVREARPEILAAASEPRALASVPLRRAVVALAVAAALTGAALSWLASSRPDGLEWSLAGAAGAEELERPRTAAHEGSAWLQDRLAVLPGYDLPERGTEEPARGEAPAWPAPSAGTSVAGLVGSGATLGLVVLAALVLGRRRRRGER